MAAKDSITIKKRVPSMAAEDGKLLAAVLLQDLSDSTECDDEPKGREILLNRLTSFGNLTQVEKIRFVEVLHDYLSSALAGVSIGIGSYFQDDWEPYRSGSDAE